MSITEEQRANQRNLKALMDRITVAEMDALAYAVKKIALSISDTPLPYSNEYIASMLLFLADDRTNKG